MLLSAYIRQLQALLEVHGDLPIVQQGYDGHYYELVEGDSLYQPFAPCMRKLVRAPEDFEAYVAGSLFTKDEWSRFAKPKPRGEHVMVAVVARDGGGKAVSTSRV